MIYVLELENAFMLEEFRIIQQKEIRGMKGNRLLMQLSALAFVSAIFFEKSFLHTSCSTYIITFIYHALSRFRLSKPFLNMRSS